MSSGITGRKFVIGCGLAGVALATMLMSDETRGDEAPRTKPVPSAETAHGSRQAASTVTRPQNSARLSDAQQALQGLTQIRHQQCQSGNQLACQALPQMPSYGPKLMQMDRACQSGDRNACGDFDKLAGQIFTAYSESAAVMRAGEAGMAQMDAWRAQMNSNAAASTANLRAQAAAGQAAHEARQEANAAMNRNWQAGQDSIDRNHGRAVDRIYEGTTMDGGGVQARIPNGSTGYTDGNGNVVAVPKGGRAPDGWTEMKDTYAAPR